MKTPKGLTQLSEWGTKTSLPLTAAINGGVRGDEIWYFPTSVNRILRDKFNAPPDRIWEELGEAGVLYASRDRLARHRQIKNVFAGKVLVVSREKLFYSGTGPDIVDLYEELGPVRPEDAIEDEYDYVLDPDGN